MTPATAPTMAPTRPATPTLPSADALTPTNLAPTTAAINAPTPAKASAALAV